MKKRLLFVCLGNICRSPSAEAVMKGILEREGYDHQVEVDSAGTCAYHAGEKADARMRNHATRRGFNLTSISRPVNPDTDFDLFDLIIGMDDENIRNLKNMTPNPDHIAKIHKMTDFGTNTLHDSVPDPYYGGANGFELVLDILEDTCMGLLNHLKNDLK